jgi:hypothetical protein
MDELEQLQAAAEAAAATAAAIHDEGALLEAEWRIKRRVASDEYRAASAALEAYAQAHADPDRPGAQTIEVTA